MRRQPPFTVGWDVAGVVAELGGGVTRFAVGDEVLGMPWFPRQAGAYAEYVSAAASAVPSPEGLPSTAASWADRLANARRHCARSARPVSAVRGPGLDPRRGGGVGHLAVQVAKAHGAYVIGTARADNHETLTGLGADELIDYRTTRFEDVVRDLDVALDLIGGQNTLRSLQVMRPGGLLIAVPSGPSAEVLAAAAKAAVRATGFLVEPDQIGLDGLIRLVETGRLRVIVSGQFPLADAATAHKAAEHGHSIGKIAITV